MRCLEKDRERRYRSVDEVRLALEPFAFASTNTPPPMMVQSGLDATMTPQGMVSTGPRMRGTSQAESAATVAPPGLGGRLSTPAIGVPALASQAGVQTGTKSTLSGAAGQMSFSETAGKKGPWIFAGGGAVLAVGALLIGLKVFGGGGDKAPQPAAGPTMDEVAPAPVEAAAPPVVAAPVDPPAPVVAPDAGVVAATEPPVVDKSSSRRKRDKDKKTVVATPEPVKVEPPPVEVIKKEPPKEEPKVEVKKEEPKVEPKKEEAPPPDDPLGRRSRGKK
jgi:hypothetical protein